MDDDAQTKLVDNERLKLLATFLNGLGIAVFAVGALAPLIFGLVALYIVNRKFGPGHRD